jgi:IS5 family transposase
VEALFLHASEIECIGKGKASALYEPGVKASIVTTNARAPGGQFVLQAKVLPGKPYDGHTLSVVIDATEKLIVAQSSAPIYKGCRGHDTANPRRVFISRSTASSAASNAKPRRRSAIAVIGHTKTDGRLGRCYLKGHR